MFHGKKVILERCPSKLLNWKLPYELPFISRKYPCRLLWSASVLVDKGRRVPYSDKRIYWGHEELPPWGPRPLSPPPRILCPTGKGFLSRYAQRPAGLAGKKSVDRPLDLQLRWRQQEGLRELPLWWWGTWRWPHCLLQLQGCVASYQQGQSDNQHLHKYYFTHDNKRCQFSVLIDV